MSLPTADQIATLAAAFDTFTRRYKLKAATVSDKALNEVDIQTLLFVANQPDCGPTDVARHLGLPLTTISSATDRLAKRSLLRRDRAEGDRRAVLLRLTESGIARVAAQRSAYDELYQIMLSRLSPSEREVFIELIAKIVENEG
jgi:DNA-binding MarR family transcriptional regulator